MDITAVQLAIQLFTQFLKSVCWAELFGLFFPSLNPRNLRIQLRDLWLDTTHFVRIGFSHSNICAVLISMHLTTSVFLQNIIIGRSDELLFPDVSGIGVVPPSRSFYLTKHASLGKNFQLNLFLKTNFRS